MDEVISQAKRHLDEIVQGIVSLDLVVINRATSKLNLDTSIELHSVATVQALLPQLIYILQNPTVLKTNDDQDGYTPIINLLQALLLQKSFEETLQFIPQDALLQGLTSGNEPLQKACILQISKAEPSDLVASTPLIEAIASVFADSSSSSAIACTAIDGIVKLSQGKLVCRRLFSGECLKVLNSCKTNDKNGIKQSRLMSLIEQILPKDDDRDIPYELIQCPPSSIEDADSDVLMVMNRIQFYKRLLANPHPNDLIANINSQINSIVKLFQQRYSNITVSSFLSSEIYDFLGVLSRADAETFKSLDNKYSIVAPTSQDDVISILSNINGDYLSQKVPQIIESLPYTVQTVAALKNLLLNENCYKLSNPTSDKLISLPALEQMVLLVSISSTTWGVNDLVHNWPSVINKLLIEKNEVRDKDVLFFKRQVYENFLSESSSTLSIWDQGLRRRYRETFIGAGGVADPGVIVSHQAGM